MNKEEQVCRKILLSFEEPFTLEELVKALINEGIMDDSNKKQILDIVEEMLERNLIVHVPLTDRYYGLNQIV